MLLSEQSLRSFTENIFTAMGAPADDARLATDVLISADLRGIDSHGVARLPGYVRLWEKRRINMLPDIRIVHETSTTATIDGDSGLGLVVAPLAMRTAIAKANEFGSGWVAVRNSNHFGIAGYHALLAVEKDMIGFVMTNASPLVTPTFSSERLLGTNPMCYAFPAGRYPPVVVDMATSAAANGKLEIAQRHGREIPEGWLQDINGKPARNPAVLRDGGALLPLGSDPMHGSHKGFGLGATVDLLSGVLSGANFGPWVPPFVSFLDPPSDPVGLGVGHFLGALRVDGFRPLEGFKADMDRWIDRFRNSATAEPAKRVIIPGEPEFEAERLRKKRGIALEPAVATELKLLAARFSVQPLVDSPE